PPEDPWHAPEAGANAPTLETVGAEEEERPSPSPRTLVQRGLALLAQRWEQALLALVFAAMAGMILHLGWPKPQAVITLKPYAGGSEAMASDSSSLWDGDHAASHLPTGEDALAQEPLKVQTTQKSR